MNNRLLLLCGGDIPFPEASITIHVPTLQEISYIGERSFFLGCEFFAFSEEFLKMKDKSNLDNQSSFDIIMTMLSMNIQTPEATELISSIYLFLGLLFPKREINFTYNEIRLIQEQDVAIINKNNFNIFQDLIKAMFCLEKKAEEKYNPAGEQASRIAKKLEERHRKLAEKDKQKKGDVVDVLNRYMSILMLFYDVNTLKQYTYYQIAELFERVQLREVYESNMKARLAGAKNLEQVDHWMVDLHS